MTAITLSRDQLQELASLVAAELARSAACAPGSLGTANLSNASGGGLVDVRTLAGRLGVSEWFVREHADELGVIRVGSGAKKRLRFDLEAAVRRYGGEGPQAVKPDSGGRSKAKRSRASARWPNAGQKAGHVLEIRGPRSA